MREKVLYAVWGGLYVVCAVLGFVTGAQGAGKVLLMLTALIFFVAFLLIVLVPSPVVNLIGCGLSGVGVAILWPGSLSKASAALPRGGTAMFALLAVAGDLGCTSGPTLVGMVSGAAGDNLKLGILAGILFPVLLVVCLLLNPAKKK